MMTEPTLSPAMKAAFAKLLRLARVEILDPGDGFLGLTGLSPETRRVHLITHLYEKELAARRAKAQEEALPAIAALVPAPPTQSPVDEALSGALKYMPSEEFSDPLPPVGMCVAAPVEQIPDVDATTPSPPAVRPCPPMPISPQPGGVPATPVVVSPMPIDIVKKSIYLKNARANEAYEGVIDVDGLKSLKLEDDGGSGLVLDETSGRLTGTPRASGDFVLRLQGLLFGKRAEIAANLAVIPDPKSLWVTVESDRSDRFWKPDEDYATAEGDLFCVAASKRGRSHAKDGTFRDDDFGLWVSGPGGWHAAVVADGAGSAKYSRRGSKIAVETVLRELPTMLDEHFTPYVTQLISLHLQGHPDAAQQIRSQFLYTTLIPAAFKAAEALETEAAAMGEKASAFSTTLIVSVARKVAQGWFIAGFSIGDGGAAAFDVHDVSVTPLTLPDSGEFAGQTRFLQKSEFAGGFPTVEKRLFFDIRPTLTAIALMTDGISDPKFPTDAVFADPAKWVDFWTDDLTKAVDFSRTNPELKTQFLDWLDFWSPGNHDDRTLVVLLP